MCSQTRSFPFLPERVELSRSIPAASHVRQPPALCVWSRIAWWHCVGHARITELHLSLACLRRRAVFPSFVAGFHEIGILGGEAKARIFAATALGEHHTHICISALCRRGASVTWHKQTNKDYREYGHFCYDFDLSVVAGQQPKRKRGMKSVMCKKCHRLAQYCAGGDSCRVTCNTPSHKSCQHLH